MPLAGGWIAPGRHTPQDATTGTTSRVRSSSHECRGGGLPASPPAVIKLSDRHHYRWSGTAGGPRKVRHISGTYGHGEKSASRAVTFGPSSTSQPSAPSARRTFPDLNATNMWGK